MNFVRQNFTATFYLNSRFNSFLCTAANSAYFAQNRTPCRNDIQMVKDNETWSFLFYPMFYFGPNDEFTFSLQFANSSLVPFLGM
jgi:hypothetical protein